MSEEQVVAPTVQQEQIPEMAELTWGIVIKKFYESLKLAGKEKQERNFKTSIKFFLEAICLTEESTVGAELTEEFEAKIELYIKYQKFRDLDESTYNPRVSKIRKLKIFVEQNFGSRLQLQTLPKAFGQRLRKLIAALGLTIRSFWLTLPKGLLGYGTLVTWCAEQSVPSRKLRQVITTIEQHLRVPAGTLRLPQYLLKLHNLRIGQSDSSNKARAALSKPYYIWTESLEVEFQDLFIHKTRAILPEGEERQEEGQWTTSEGGGVPAAEIAMNTLKSFMGFCALPVDSPDPYLRGAGIKLENLSLALLADKGLVERYLEFMKLRSGLRVKQVNDSTKADLPAHKISANGLWEYYDKGGKYNGGSLRVLSFISSLLYPRTGYLYQHPEYAEKLGPRMTAATWKEQCRKTRNRVAKLYKDILKMKKNGDRDNFDFGRDPKELIQWILDLDRPLLILQEMIKDMLEDFLPESAPLRARARQYRDLILVALLCANPLRIRMFSIMKFDENLLRRSDGSWWLKFNKRAFKNRRALESEYCVRVAKELWPMLDRYKEEFHPFLVGSTGSRYVFVVDGNGPHARDKGAPLSAEGLSRIIRNLTGLFLPGAIGFRAHAFRHIIATDIIRKDPRVGFFLASKALHDKLETVEKEYIHMKTSEFFEPVNIHFGEAWRMIFKSSQAGLRDTNVQLASR